MIETINDRMEMLINERFNGNKAAFAKSIGLPPTGLSNYLGKQRRSKPSVDMIAKIIQVLGVDANWLILGEQREATPQSKVEAHDSGQAAGRDINNNGMCIHDCDTNTRVDDLKQAIEQLKSQLNDKERLIQILMKQQ
jgi:transcriptional regulator with XRE-family HTH domain